MSSPLADLIQRGESGAKSYDNYNRGTYTDSEGRERVRGADGDIDFSSLTIGQVLDRQGLARDDADRLFAVGRYQIIPKTMTGAVQELGLERDAAFTDAVQDRIFSNYLITEKRPAIGDYITGEQGATLEQAQLALSQEWASIANPGTGKSYYDKPGGANHASISAGETADALNQMRNSYRAAIAEGLTADQAWDRINAQPARSLERGGAPARDPMADGVLIQGERGQAVKAMQEKLVRLGYTGADGRPLVADEDFGRNTRFAVEQFQRDHGLEVDGKAGRNTLGALDAEVAARGGQRPSSQAQPSGTGGQLSAGAAPITMASAGDANFPRFGQAVEKLEGLEAQRAQAGLAPLFGNRQELENAAGQVAYETRVAGLERIDAIVARPDGSGVFAVQGALGDPASHRVFVDRAQAVGQSIEASSQQLNAYNRQLSQEQAQSDQAQSPGIRR